MRLAVKALIKMTKRIVSERRQSGRQKHWSCESAEMLGTQGALSSTPWPGGRRERTHQSRLQSRASGETSVLDGMPDSQPVLLSFKLRFSPVQAQHRADMRTAAGLQVRVGAPEV